MKTYTLTEAHLIAIITGAIQAAQISKQAETKPVSPYPALPDPWEPVKPSSTVGPKWVRASEVRAELGQIVSKGCVDQAFMGNKTNACNKMFMGMTPYCRIDGVPYFSRECVDMYRASLRAKFPERFSR
jgi:hypothetical protein